MRAIEQMEKEQMRMDLPDFRAGDTVIDASLRGRLSRLELDLR